MKIDSRLYTGTINKDLRLTYTYDYQENGQFQTITFKGNGRVIVRPSFNITISEGFDKPRLFLPSTKYHSFTALLRKSIDLISKNLYEIFPNVGRIEFEADSRVLERFQTEQALATDGITAMPCVWVDPTGSCFPGVRLNSLNGSVSIPLEDAIPMSELLNNFDPYCYGISIMRAVSELVSGAYQ